MSDITLLIPFFNEGERILRVLEKMTQIPEIDQIICVDDGSTDNSSQEILKHFDVEIIRLPHNTGKSAAVRAGMNHVVNEWVFLCDADLSQIEVEEFRTACQFVRSDQADMVVLRRTKAPWFVKFDRGDILFSGERIVKTRDLKEVFSKEIEHYQLEIAINQWMLDHQKKAYWFPSSVTNTYKFQKLGLAKGLTKEFRMWYNLVYFIGPANYIRQIRSFATQTLDTPVYRLEPKKVSSMLKT